MFTGLIQDIGTIEKISPTAEGKKITVKSALLRPHLKIDDSVAINGVCQTVVALGHDQFTVDCVHVTLQKTTLAQLQSGMEVNLELALRPMDRLGGHFVQGHVNGTGEVKNFINQGQNYLLTLTYPSSLRRYLVQEGSITLDGVSLTIAHLSAEELQVSIIPHTWKKTIWKNIKRGQKVNIEVDLLAKYVESLLTYARPEERTTFSDQSQSLTPTRPHWVEWSPEKGFY